MIKSIWVDAWSEFASDLTDINQPHINLGRMTFFIGRNNSGKSRLLRGLFASTPESMAWIHTHDKLDEWMEDLRVLATQIPDNGMYGALRGQVIRHFMHEKRLLRIGDRESLRLMEDDISSLIAGGNLPVSQVSIPQLRLTVQDRIKTQGREFFQKQISRSSLSPRIYIPILRGLRPLTIKHADSQKNKFDHHYLERTKEDYFSGEPDAIKKNIITGEMLYSLLVQNLLGEPRERERIREYEAFLSTNFFAGKTISLIPKHNDDVINVFIEGETQRPIYDLGDGLQQIIIITAAAFLAVAPSLVLIEEPENSLHPGMLRQLIKFLIERTEHQYIITTHSNHILEFAEECDDCVTYKLKKEVIDTNEKFHITQANSNRHLLIELGVKASSLYLANCTIWVEGITDRLYIQAFLKRYISSLDIESDQYQTYSKYIENYHYSFVEYQGANLTHWTFSEMNAKAIQELRALSVTVNAFLIADGDIKNKGNRVEKLAAELNDRFYLLECKEIENLIPFGVVKAVAIEMFGRKRKKFGTQLNQLESLNDCSFSNSEDGLGFHLDQALGLQGQGKDCDSIFASDSGTLKEKTAFCEKAVAYMRDNPWKITPELGRLCERILHLRRIAYKP